MRCPECEGRINAREATRFLWFLAIECPGCRSSVKLDRRGRFALVATMVAAVLVTLLLQLVTDSGLVMGSVLIAGIFLAGRSAMEMGKLVVVPKEDNNSLDS